MELGPPAAVPPQSPPASTLAKPGLPRCSFQRRWAPAYTRGRRQASDPAQPSATRGRRGEAQPGSAALPLQGEPRAKGRSILSHGRELFSGSVRRADLDPENRGPRAGRVRGRAGSLAGLAAVSHPGASQPLGSGVRGRLSEAGWSFPPSHRGRCLTPSPAGEAGAAQAPGPGPFLEPVHEGGPEVLSKLRGWRQGQGTAPAHFTNRFLPHCPSLSTERTEARSRRPESSRPVLQPTLPEPSTEALSSRAADHSFPASRGEMRGGNHPRVFIAKYFFPEEDNAVDSPSGDWSGSSGKPT